MPIAPVSIPEHPADLVVDAFGACLGKRSERLIVRWRERRNQAPPAAEDVSQSASHSMPDIPPAGVGIRAVSNRPKAADSADPSASASAESSNSDRAASATRGLLRLWAHDAAASRPVRNPPIERLRERLSELADAELSPEGPTGWQERAVPLSRLKSVVVAGRGITISSDLIEALIERGISLSFLGGQGQPVAHLSAPGLGGTVQTRRAQLAASSSPLGVELAVAFVQGKLRNQMHQLQSAGKYLKSADAERFAALQKKIVALRNLRRQVRAIVGDNLDRQRDGLMGYEGTGARLYWEGIALVLAGRYDFPGRRTRGADDPVNAALNYGYGILYARTSAALLNAGLELYAGFLHVDRPGKPALVLDLVEEFRAPVVDRVVVALANQGVALDVNEHGLQPAARRAIAERITERLAAAVPYEGKRWPLGMVIQQQARHLAVAVRGERTYRPFASRW